MGGDALQKRELAIRIFIRFNRAAQLLNQVRKFLIRRKREMPGTTAGLALRKRWLSRLQRFFGRFIKLIDHYLIGAEVRRKNKMLIGRKNRAMYMRRFLPLFITAAAAVLNQLGIRLQFSVGCNGQRRTVATHIIRYHGPMITFIYRNIAGRITSGRLGI